MKKLISLAFLLWFASLTVFPQASLYVLDPDQTWYWRSARIDKATVSVKPAGAYFEMGLYLDISSKGSNLSKTKQLESFMTFKLPDGAHILDSWLWVGEDIVQGRITDKWTANSIYEGIVDRRRDPSILKKIGKNLYELRIYPHIKEEVRRVKITYIVPGRWINGRMATSFPTDIFRASNSDPALDILVWEEAGFSAPELSPLSEQSFAALNDEEFGDYKHIRLSPEAYQQGLSLTMDVPTINGMFFYQYETGVGEGFYQLGLNFQDVIPSDEPKNIAVMVDYDPTLTNLDRGLIFSKLKEEILATCSTKDSFNLFYSKLSVHQQFEDWMPVTSHNLNTAFQEIEAGFSTLFSNLPGVIVEVQNFLVEKGGGVAYLVSNVDNYNTQHKANTLLKELEKLDLYPIYISDLQNTSFSRNRIGSNYFYGQDYFFKNLSKLTHAAYYRLRDESSIDQVYNKTMGALDGYISALDFYTSTENGFCYARYAMNENEVYHPGDMYVQQGRYIGDAPFIIDISGIHNKQAFNHKVQLHQEQIFMGDSMLQKAWIGARIAHLETQTGTHENIIEILNESLNHRVLSKYSAFLCLEPSDSVAVCISCQDESRLTGIYELEILKENSLSLYPNPCVDKLTIAFTSPADWGEAGKIEIVDITGRVVFRTDIRLAPQKRNEQTWNLTNEVGEPVDDGIYFVCIKSGNNSVRKTLVVHR